MSAAQPAFTGAGRAPDPKLRRARLATSAVFLLTGFLFASWAARIPTIKAQLGLGDGQLAIALIGLEAGAVAGLQLGAVVVTRLGSRRVLLIAVPAFAALLLPIGYAWNLVTLGVAAGLSAAANSVVDVAMNDQGVGVQHGYGRSLLSGMHAMHSLGGVLGAGVGAAAAHFQVSVTIHFTIVAVAVAAASLPVTRALLTPAELHGDQASRTARSTPLLAGWTGRLVVIGVVAFVFAFGEAVGLNWGSVLLAEHRGASPALAAAGLSVFLAAVTLGRLFGDRIVDRFGPGRVFAGGALVAGTGLTAGLLLGSAAAAVGGLALLGIGLATLLPISISAAGASSNLPVPVAVARIATLGYLGSFTAPALIGYLASQTSLPTALLLPAIAIAATAIAAPVVRPPRDGPANRRAASRSPATSAEHDTQKG
jgi:MFS family permease